MKHEWNNLNKTPVKSVHIEKRRNDNISNVSKDIIM
jgi:hypothetical protein